MKYILKCIVVVTFFSFMPKISAISNIKVDNYDLVPFFDDYVTKYNVFVDKEDNEVNISVLTSEDDEYVTGVGNVNILDGKTEVTLKVVKKDTSIIDYQIVIYKNYEENKDYDDALLKSLEIEGHDINFDSNNYEYKINVENEERLNIDYEQNSEYSTVKISGNSNFKLGENIIKITVISKSKNYSNIYVLKVNKIADVFKEESSMKKEENILGKEELTKKETNIIMISIISICSILIVFIFYLFFGSKRKRS